MLRLIFFPFILLVLFLFLVIMTWLIYKKLKKGVGYTIKKGAKIASDQQQKWNERGQLKKFPEILQKGFQDYDDIHSITKSLPESWSLSIIPLVSTAKDVLDEVALEFRGIDTPVQRNKENKKLNSIRGFFIHTLDALLQFVEKLSSDHQKMNAEEIEKARQNINVFKADLLRHQETLHKVRRFDFDVVMDVIKARLK